LMYFDEDQQSSSEYIQAIISSHISRMLSPKI
jgi:hypothetical protein